MHIQFRFNLIYDAVYFIIIIFFLFKMKNHT